MEKNEETTEAASSSGLDEGKQQQAAQNCGSPATAGNPAISLLQVSQNVNEPCSPALQFDGSLNESANDCYTPGDGIKLPQLESTRISNNYPGGDFEADNDLSKAQSEPGDSQNLFNTGFVKTNLIPADTSSLNESSSDLGTYESVEKFNMYNMILLFFQFRARNSQNQKIRPSCQLFK